MKLLEVSVISTVIVIVFAADTMAHNVLGRCGPQGDIVFVLDKSGSVGSSNFKRMINFVKYIVTKFVVNRSHVQFGLVTYSSGVATDFYLNSYSNVWGIWNALSRVRYSGGGTNTAGALHYIRTSSFSYMHGHRRGVPKLAVVITDGNSNNYAMTKRQAQLAHSSGIQIMAIGVGKATNKRELRDIASDPDSEFVFDLNSFSALQAIKYRFADIACGVVWRSMVRG
uniref:Cartilage matrix protein-like n=1 Tax=Crassostrea virginica TaxID=6565 RepID=A0A8B8CE74_CRAVI|nr:cartilage matrix protein-like [Crassostrea virginica]